VTLHSSVRDSIFWRAIFQPLPLPFYFNKNTARKNA